jgi:ferric-dicitrate binding protein FerR (iron transport regulator)
LRNIDPGLVRSAAEANPVLRPARTSVQPWRRRIQVVLALAALSVAAAGCAANTGATKSANIDGNNQLRYYGGPKYPMWSGQ